MTSSTGATGSTPRPPSDIESMPLPKFMQRAKAALAPAQPSATASVLGAAGAVPVNSAGTPGTGAPAPASSVSDNSSPNEGRPFGNDDTAQARSAWDAYANLTPGDRYRMQREGKAAPTNPDAPTGADAYRAVREGRGQVSQREQDIVGAPAQPSAAAPMQAIPTTPSSGGNRSVRQSANQQAIPTSNGAAGPQVRTAAPNYLPGAVPGVTISPSSPLAQPSSPMPGAYPAPSTMAQPQAPGMTPSLANSMPGLGAQILRSLNPGL